MGFAARKTTTIGRSGRRPPRRPPPRVALEDEDAAWMEALCLRLATHPDGTLRGHAMSGLAIAAQRRRLADRREVVAVIRRALRDADPAVRAGAAEAAGVVEGWMGWRVGTGRG